VGNFVEVKMGGYRPGRDVRWRMWGYGWWIEVEGLWRVGEFADFSIMLL